MQALKRDWGTTHLRATDGEGVALVFINSLGTDLRMWDDVVALLPAGWSNLRMDKRGHGLSSTAPRGYGIPELAVPELSALMERSSRQNMIFDVFVDFDREFFFSLTQPAQ